MRSSLFILFIIFSLASNGFASTWPTSNVCSIEAEVLDMNKRWIADAEPDLGAYVQLTLKIKAVGPMVRKYSDSRPCNDVFPIGKELIVGEYEKTLLGNVQTLKEGEGIKAAIVSYVKSGGIRPYYVFQATEEDTPLIKVID